MVSAQVPKTWGCFPFHIAYKWPTKKGAGLKYLLTGMILPSCQVHGGEIFNFNWKLPKLAGSNMFKTSWRLASWTNPRYILRQQPIKVKWATFERPLADIPLWLICRDPLNKKTVKTKTPIKIGWDHPLDTTRRFNLRSKKILFVPHKTQGFASLLTLQPSSLQTSPLLVVPPAPLPPKASCFGRCVRTQARIFLGCPLKTWKVHLEKLRVSGYPSSLKNSRWNPFRIFFHFDDGRTGKIGTCFFGAW